MALQTLMEMEQAQGITPRRLSRGMQETQAKYAKAQFKTLRTHVRGAKLVTHMLTHTHSNTHNFTTAYEILSK
jgi:hypothetical protein